MKKEYHIYDNVKLGRDMMIGAQSIIGLPPSGVKEGELKTVVGDKATIRANTIIYAGNIIGDNFQTGHHILIRENNEIGNNVSIGTGTDIEYEVRIEDGVRVHSQAFIPEYSVLEEGCWIGPNVVLTNAKFPRSRGVKDHLQGPVIKKYAKVGANATILPGVKVGEWALIGAGAVITKDVQDRCVVVGNPAKIVSKITDLRRNSQKDKIPYYNLEEMEESNG